MRTLKHIVHELVEHAPFTALGAVAGIIVMVIIHYANAPRDISEALFYTLHPLHIVLSALVTTAMYRLHKRGSLWATIQLNLAAWCSAAMAMPTPLANPCPSGPVVVSTPGVIPYSG